MKIKVLRNTRASGVSLIAGKTCDVSEADAKILIALKKAAAVGKKSVESEEESKDKSKKK